MSLIEELPLTAAGGGICEPILDGDMRADSLPLLGRRLLVSSGVTSILAFASNVTLIDFVVATVVLARFLRTAEVTKARVKTTVS